MGTIKFFRNLADAEGQIGVIADQIDVCHPDNKDCEVNIVEIFESKDWFEENTKGLVACLFEHMYEKMYMVFLFQYEEDAVAFKLYWF